MSQKTVTLLSVVGGENSQNIEVQFRYFHDRNQTDSFPVRWSMVGH